MTGTSIKFSLTDLVWATLSGLIMAIVTFPEIDLTYSPGIDQSLPWVFNHIFESGFDKGISIVFPHGPLAFFMYPLASDFHIAVAVLSVLKILITILLVVLLADNGFLKWLFAPVVSLAFFVIADFNLLLIIGLILLYCLYFIHEKTIFKISGFALLSLAFFVKAYAAIVCSIITAVFLIYFLWKNRKIVPFLLDIALMSLLLCVVWLAMYGSLKGIMHYMMGMYALAGDNSSAAALYPQNNWLLLSVYIIISSTIWFVFKSDRGFFYGLIILPSLFAAWKHGMARQDVYHTHGLLFFNIAVFLIFILFVRRKKPVMAVVSFIALLSLYINNLNAINYKPVRLNFNGTHYFFQYISEFSIIKNQADSINYENVKSDILPESIRKNMGYQTVDVYPWDYAIIPANNLNWRPRPVIQTYASYTSWLDRLNASHFASENAPDFLIWDFQKITFNVSGGNFESIDHRYLLNDEPNTIISLMQHYSLWYKQAPFLVFQKCKNYKPLNVTSLQVNSVKWDEWVEVPAFTGDLLRLKLNIPSSFLRSLKSFLYKDEQFYLLYRFDNGWVFPYRIVPKNAVDGLWISPYIHHVFQQNSQMKLKSVAFSCSDKMIMPDSVFFNFEVIDFEDSVSDIYFVQRFFGNFENDMVVAENSAVSFDPSYENKYWHKIDTNNLLGNEMTGYEYCLQKGAFSPSFTWKPKNMNDFQVITQVLMKAPGYNYSENTRLVISVENAAGIIKWDAAGINSQLIDAENWNYITHTTHISGNKDTTLFVKVYLWNTSENPVYLRDHKVMITETR